jgi:L-amino acid N-acyltransferase YncA
MIPRRSLLEVLKERYPRTVELRSGRRVVIRPLERNDEASLLRYFTEIPPAERVRFFRETSADPAVVADWCRQIDPTRVLAVVALEGGEIVADGSLHPAVERMKSHVAQIRLSVHPKMRGVGAGRAVVDELLTLAPHMGMAWVDAEIAKGEEVAQRVFRSIGFQQVGILPEHVRDSVGNLHDLILLTRDVRRQLDPDIGGAG